MDTAGIARTIAVTLLFAGAVACGRIPGLYDASARPAKDAASPEDAPNSERFDAIPDVVSKAELVAGTGGARSDARDVAGLGSGGMGGAGGATSSCSGVLVSAVTRQPADVLLVLDRSGSMYYNIGEECSCDPSSNPRVVCADTVHCQTRWQSLVAALDSTLSATPYLHWGLKLFASPNAGGCKVSSGVDVPPSASSAAAIESLMAETSPLGETPTAAAIATATAYLRGQGGTNTKMLLLATDGKPNCAGSPPSVYEDDVAGTIDAITGAFSAGFLVYVVGIGTGTSLVNLDTFAEAGGTGSHYSADSLDGLTAALGAVSKQATCTFSLAQRPWDPAKVAVYLDKAMVPRDSTNGWTFAADAQTVILHGSYCDQALSEPTDAVQALFSCNLPLPAVLP